MKTWKILEDEQDSNNLKFKDKPIDWNGWTWQDNAIDYLMNHFLYKNQRRTVLDIGANIGVSSVAFSTRFENVHSFEMRQDTYNCLKENVSHLENVSTYNVTLSNDEQELKYHKYLRSGMSKIIENKNEQVQDGFIEENICKTTRLDTFDFKNVDFIKIDVEGHENQVLQGSVETIKKYKPLLMIEIFSNRTHENFLRRQKTFKILDDLGYKFKDTRAWDFIFEYNR